MAASLNKVTLIGYVGSVDNVQGLFYKLSIVTNQNYKDKTGEWKQDSQWHQVTVNSAYFDKINGVEKGSTIYIEGMIKYTKKDDKTYTSITADKILKIINSGVKKEDGEEVTNERVASPKVSKQDFKVEITEDIDEEMPF